MRRSKELPEHDPTKREPEAVSRIPHTEESREEEERLNPPGKSKGYAKPYLRSEDIPFWFTDIGTEYEGLDETIKKEIIAGFNTLPIEIKKDILKQLQDEARLGNFNDEDGELDVSNVFDRARFLVDRNLEIVEKGIEKRSGGRSQRF